MPSRRGRIIRCVARRRAKGVVQDRGSVADRIFARRVPAPHPPTDLSRGIRRWGERTARRHRRGRKIQGHLATQHEQARRKLTFKTVRSK